MKFAISLASVLVLFGSNAFAQATISTGCFRFGTELCDPTSNPPSINLGGFHEGEVNPQEGANPSKTISCTGKGVRLVVSADRTSVSFKATGSVAGNLPSGEYSLQQFSTDNSTYVSYQAEQADSSIITFSSDGDWLVGADGYVNVKLNCK